MAIIMKNSLRQVGNANEIFEAPIDEDMAHFLGKI